MKKIRNILNLSLLAVVLTTSSCSDFLDVNKDPNRVTGDNITPDLIFTQAENAVGVRQASRFIFMNNWMGYWSRSGTFIVEQEETTYKVANTFTENNWDQAYNILFDLYQVKTRALAANDSVLTGASMVLSAKLWQETVDQFGAVPYSQAFDYVKYPRPAYDKATDIYADLLTQLDKAISYLDATAPKSSFAKTDIIFARGIAIKELPTVVAKWKKLANTIKLRIYLRQSEKGFVPTAAQIAKITADGGFFAAGEDVSVNPGYTNQTDKQNPFYAAFGLTASGAPATTNNKPNNYFVKTILGSTDARLTRLYSNASGKIDGTDYGALGGNKIPNGATITGTEIGPGLAGSSEQDQFIMPSFESLFFQAEATARGWLPGGDAAAKALFESGIKQSFRWLGVTTTKTLLTGTAITDSISDKYIQNVTTANWANSGTTAADKVKFIAFQKYIALCGVDAIESWSDLRRGVLVLPAGYLSNNPVRATNLPTILPYPQTEITTNKANLPERDKDAIFTEKLFWQP
ncbi:MAG TPA: SusD/RagB family nutrient-binding outer membrane lipoprotein [Paludibacter sp.]